MSFVDDISKFAAKAEKNVDQVVRVTLFDVMKSIDTLSPVGDPSFWRSPPPSDYEGGHFRTNWQLTEGSPPTGEIEGTNWRGALAREMEKVPVKVAGKVFYYGNTVDYAQDIEDGTGSPRQAPYGVVAITAAKFQSIIDVAVSKVNK